jgi:diaminopimelate decarboxylase
MSRIKRNLNREVLEELSSLYGDSFYLLDSYIFEKNYEEFLNEFQKIYAKTYIGYSYKTNYIPKLCSIINRKNGFAEVVSNMEYALAEKIGVAPEKIIVNGPYKIKEDVERMLLQGSIVNLDSFYEIDIVEEIAFRNRNSKLNIGIRCNFEIDGQSNSRFGFDVNTKNFIEVFNKLQKIENINITGLHCHFPNRNLESYESRVDEITLLVDKLFSTPPEYISVGGGYSGKMDTSLEKQFKYKTPQYDEYAEVVATKFNEHYKNIKDELKPKLFLEPGTAIAADTMKFVARVIDIKNIRGNYIATTTGSKFNVGSFASTINLPMNVFSDRKNKKDNYFDVIDISGYTCIEGDILYKGFKGNINVGDFIVFNNVGSYSFNFKPPFILPNVAIIDYNFNNSNHEVVKRKEEFDDIFRTFFDKNMGELDG